jgi:hypothetical protein
MEELMNGHDLDHLVSDTRHRNHVAAGFRIIARNLALGMQIAAAQARPNVLREPLAFRASQAEGLGTFVVEHQTIRITDLRPSATEPCRLPWLHRTVLYAA